MTQVPTDVRPPRSRPALLPATVVRTEPLSPAMVRVVFGGLTTFTPSEYTDSYVKLTFRHPGVTYPEPYDMAVIKSQLPADQWPDVRTYTVRWFNPDTAQLAIDFVVHGDAGVAGPWAATATAGDELLLSGPGGAYRPDPAADWHLFVGDESAIPAIAAALDALPGDARGLALLEVADASGILRLSAPTGVHVSWLISGGRPVGDALIAAAGELSLPAGVVEAFVHGEAGFVKEYRRILRVDHGLPKERLSISGYWRVGVDENGWRAGKAEWNRQAEQAEQAAGIV